MQCLTGCFGSPNKSAASRGCDGPKISSPCAGKATPVTGGRRTGGSPRAEQLDWAGLVPLLTGDVTGDWWDILQSASAALIKRVPADHASIFMLAGAGVAALSSCGLPLFGLQLGQLLLPSPGSRTSTDASSDDLLPISLPEVDVCMLAAALQEQTASVPIVFRSVALGKQQQEQRQQQPTGLFGSTDGGSVTAVKKGTAGKHHKDRSTGGGAAGSSFRHFVAVGIPGGKLAAGMFILSAIGPAPPAAWQSEGLGLVAALLAPLLRPPQVPLARRTLAELHAASTINELVHALSAAAADLLLATVRVAMQPRVALMRNDGTAAAVFSVSEGAGGGGTSVCQRRSREVVLVDGGGSGFSGFKQPSEFFMLGHTDRDSTGTACGGGGGGGGGGGNLGKSLGDQSFARLAGAPSAVSVPGGAGCRGQSLPLQHTLLSEALTHGSGLCIADCNAYVQDSKAFPRDLMLFPRGGAAPPQSLALATSCHSGRPLLALYATYHSILPQALLQTVVQELGQLLRALTPTVAALLMAGGPMADEWILLHDDLLGPAGVGLSSNAVARQRISNNAALTPPPLPLTPPPLTLTPPPLTLTPLQGAGAVTAAAASAPPAAMVMAAGPAAAGSADIGGRVSSVESQKCGMGGWSPRSSNGGPAAVAAVTAAAGGTPTGVMAQIGAFFRRPSTTDDNRQPNNNNNNNNHNHHHNSNAAKSPTASGAGEGGGCVPTPREVVLSAMNAAAEAVLVGGIHPADDPDAAVLVRGGDSTPTATKRLAAFVSNGHAAATAAATPPVGSLRSVLSRTATAHSYTGRTSFSLEAAGSPRGGLRLAPLITTLHDRLKSAQAEQLTASSRAASTLQDLDSLRFLERVGKGGYGSVYRGLYHGSEVAIKVVEDPNTSLVQPGAAANGAKPPPASAAASVILKAKHLHDAVELVASVSMSHPNIVQLISYFVDVRANHLQRPRLEAAQGAAAAGQGWPAADDAAAAGGARATTGYDGGGGGGGGGDGADGESGLLQLVHMASSGVDSTSSSFTEPSGNEAIVLVMEYCDRGSLKEAVQDGFFLQREALAQVQLLYRHHHNQQQQQAPQQAAAAQQAQQAAAAQQAQQAAAAQQAQQAAQQMLSRGGVALLNMKSVYSTLLEVALALRHMHGLHMVHCDLKPQNVLLKSSPRDPRGFTAKLSDFGLAKMMAHDEGGQMVISEGIQSGTITHLPPEALQGARQLGPAVDVYAFGVVMFQMLCGMNVYRGMDVKQMIRGVVRNGLRPAFPAWVPVEYRVLAQRCWHEEPSRRPTSLQLVSELETLLEAIDAPNWPPFGRRGVGVAMGGSIGSVRSGLGGTVAAATAASSQRRLPPRCATETAIHCVMRPPPPLTSPPAAPEAAMSRQPPLTPPPLPLAPSPLTSPEAAMSRQPPPIYLYQPPQQLYQPSGVESRSPAAAAGHGGAAGCAVPAPAAVGADWMIPTHGSSGAGSACATKKMVPHPPSLYTRTPAMAAAPPAAPTPAAGAVATSPGATSPRGVEPAVPARPSVDSKAAAAPDAGSATAAVAPSTAAGADVSPPRRLGAPLPVRAEG